MTCWWMIEIWELIFDWLADCCSFLDSFSNFFLLKFIPFFRSSLLVGRQLYFSLNHAWNQEDWQEKSDGLVYLICGMKWRKYRPGVKLQFLIQRRYFHDVGWHCGTLKAIRHNVLTVIICVWTFVLNILNTPIYFSIYYFSGSTLTIHYKGFLSFFAHIGW